jgi:hypothetical protein
MAEQIQQAIAQDPAGLAPGTAETPPQQQAPPAGAQKADTPADQGPPETIPYARFKEVNDRLNDLKGYEELAQYGYDPDSLGRLAAFEAQYMTDPIGTWARLADDLDLPPEVKEALTKVEGYTPSAEGEPPAVTPEGGGTPSQGSGPDGNLPPKVQDALQWIEQRKAAEAEQASSKTLDEIIGHWNRLDGEAGIETPDHIKLAMISAAAAQGGFTTPMQLAEKARGMIVDYRDQTLGSVVGSRRPGSPLAVPGSGPAGTPPQKFSSLQEAGKAAIADLEAGRLPSVTGA